MGTGYVRQSSATIVDGLVVNAAPLNAEFNAVKDAFDGTAGHSHDGTSGEGQKISLTTAVAGILPAANGGTGSSADEFHETTGHTHTGIAGDGTKIPLAAGVSGTLPVVSGGTGSAIMGSGSNFDADLLDGQHGSYYLPAAAYTAADVLTKLLTVDGAGSTLDADTVDGKQAALFAELTGADFTGLLTSTNSVVSKNGQLVSYGWGGDVTEGIVFLNQAGTRYLHNDGTNYYMPGANLYIDSFLAWTSGNDGSGSGMDTDLVRGVTPGATGLALLDDTTSANARTTISAAARASTLPWDVIIEDRKSSGTSGGNPVSATWNIRTLNTLVYNRDTMASLSSNEFTLQAGTYLIDASAGALYTDGHQVRLYNVTDAASVELGTTANCENPADYTLTRSRVMTVVTIATAKAYRIEHYTVIGSTGGFGYGVGAGGEVYARVLIKKLEA